jgi:hypothetical protein
MSNSLTSTPLPNDLIDFLGEVEAKHIPATPQGRLIFGIDATASRQPTWDLATAMTATMLAETKGLDLQLAYYRGYDECRTSSWIRSADLLSRMTGKIMCEAGATQIKRILDHALKETTKLQVSALVFIGDAMEEDPDALVLKARELGKRKVPIFAFLEGNNTVADISFKALASASGGAFARFDTNAAKQLGELLSAVVVYAVGGLEALTKQKSLSSTRLIEQLRGGAST